MPPELKSYYSVKFYSTNLDKDDALFISQNAHICLEEIDTMSVRIANYFKATITAVNTNNRRRTRANEAGYASP